MFFVRVDLSPKSGLGHFNRIIAILNHLKIKNYKIVVDRIINSKLVEKHKNNLIELYKDNKFKNELDDSKLFANILKKQKLKSHIIKDSYKLGYKWERYISRFSKKIIVISDNHKIKHYADFYINHSPKFSKISDKDFLLIKKNNKWNCNFLLGPKYALFSKKEKYTKKFISDLVFYNGASGNLLIYEQTIKNIMKLKKNFKIVIIIGPNFKNNFKIKNNLKMFKNVSFIHGPENIYRYLIGTKLFISSAGISMFEASNLKKPSLLFRNNENQNLSDDSYENLGHYFVLDKKDLRSPKKVADLILLMLKNIIKIKKLMSKRNLSFNFINKNYKKNLLKKL